MHSLLCLQFFQVLPSVHLAKMAEDSWSWYLAKLGAKVGAKVLINMYVPGLEASVEFVDAAKCFYYGDTTGGVINILSGVGDVVSFRLTGTIKDAMTGSGKAAAIETVKEMGKSAPKEVTKKLGQQAGKEFAKGVLTEATEEVWREGTKMTLNKAGQDAVLAAISSGGRKVGKTIGEDLLEKLAFETMVKGTKMGAFELTKNAAKEGAEREFMKNSYKLVAKGVIFAASKGAANSYGRKDKNSQ